MDYAQLKEKHRRLRDVFHPNLSLRTHRALSWLQHAEATEDQDSQFIFLWIAFNSAYATDIDEQYRTTERGMFESFFDKLISLDEDSRLYSLAWSEFSNTIRLLLGNQYIYQPFWDFHNGKLTESEWLDSFQHSKRRVAQGLGSKNTQLVLSVVFRRLYTLRNQLMHGGATWNSSANRSQVKDGAALMMKVVPVIIDLMLDNPQTLWGDPYYPYINN